MAVSTHAEGEQDSAGPSEPRDEQGISEFVSHFGGLMAASGMPGLTGYVFALLLAQPDAELTAQQIGQALNVSPAAVSGATKYLADIGFTRRLRRPGSRRVVHALSSDDWYDALLGRSNVIEGSKRLFLEGSRAPAGWGRQRAAGCGSMPSGSPSWVTPSSARWPPGRPNARNCCAALVSWTMRTPTTGPRSPDRPCGSGARVGAHQAFERLHRLRQAAPQRILVEFVGRGQPGIQGRAPDAAGQRQRHRGARVVGRAAEATHHRGLQAGIQGPAASAHGIVQAGAVLGQLPHRPHLVAGELHLVDAVADDVSQGPDQVRFAPAGEVLQGAVRVGGDLRHEGVVLGGEVVEHGAARYARRHGDLVNGDLVGAIAQGELQRGRADGPFDPLRNAAHHIIIHSVQNPRKDAAQVAVIGAVGRCRWVRRGIGTGDVRPRERLRRDRRA
ncbi:Transcription regulator [Propionibacterium freudenreichii]|nr:Transcription regulator [Propionibacterium freudenreichii]